jgi:hypothetical protein
VSGKATRAVIAQRVEAVFQLRLGGAEFHDIVEYANATQGEDGNPKEPWGVKETQLRNYIKKADRLCKERLDAKADHLLARHLLQRRRLYAHAMEMGDYKTALAVLKDEAELEGLYPAKKAEVTGANGGPVATCRIITDEERNLALLAILARLGEGGGRPAANGQLPPHRPLLGLPGADPDRRGDEPRPLADGPAPRPLFG